MCTQIGKGSSLSVDSLRVVVGNNSAAAPPQQDTYGQCRQRPRTPLTAPGLQRLTQQQATRTQPAAQQLSSMVPTRQPSTASHSHVCPRYDADQGPGGGVQLQARCRYGGTVQQPPQPAVCACVAGPSRLWEMHMVSPLQARHQRHHTPLLGAGDSPADCPAALCQPRPAARGPQAGHHPCSALCIMNQECCVSSCTSSGQRAKKSP